MDMILYVSSPVLLPSWILFDQHHIFSPRTVAGISTNGICIFLVFTVSKNLCLSELATLYKHQTPPSSADTFIRNAVMIHFDLGVGLFTSVSSMEKTHGYLAGNEHSPSPGEKETHLQKYRGVAGCAGSLPGSFLLSVFLFQPIFVCWEVVGNTFVGKLGEVSKNAKGG